MFAPQPPTDDGRVMVEGWTAEGKPWDPLNQEPSTFDLNPYGGFGMNQLWGDFHRRIFEQRFSSYWPGLREYFLRYHEIVERPELEMSGFVVWHLTEQLRLPWQAPPPPPQKNRLFSWGRTTPPGSDEASHGAGAKRRLQSPPPPRPRRVPSKPPIPRPSR
jgi:hypothetical protein